MRKCCYCLRGLDPGEALDYLGDRVGHRGRQRCVELLRMDLESAWAQIERLLSLLTAVELVLHPERAGPANDPTQADHASELEAATSFQTKKENHV